MLSKDKPSKYITYEPKAFNQQGTETKVLYIPRIMTVNVNGDCIELPDTPVDGTLIVYGTNNDGVVDTNMIYTSGDHAGDNVYALIVENGVTKLIPPTNATENIVIKYEFGKMAAIREQTNLEKVVGFLDVFYPLNCECCGALLRSSVCEYCGAEYVKRR